MPVRDRLYGKKSSCGKKITCTFCGTVAKRYGRREDGSEYREQYCSDCGVLLASPTDGVPQYWVPDPDELQRRAARVKASNPMIQQMIQEDR